MVSEHGTGAWHPSPSWWRHQMETFSALLATCAGNSPVTGEIPAQRSVMRSFDVFFDLHLNKLLSKQSQGWWFETQSCSLWRHGNAHADCSIVYKDIAEGVPLRLWGRNLPLQQLTWSGVMSIITFIYRATWPSKNPMELFLNAKILMKSWATAYHHQHLVCL